MFTYIMHCDYSPPCLPPVHHSPVLLTSPFLKLLPFHLALWLTGFNGDCLCDCESGTVHLRLVVSLAPRVGVSFKLPHHPTACIRRLTDSFVACCSPSAFAWVLGLNLCPQAYTVDSFTTKSSCWALQSFSEAMLQCC